MTETGYAVVPILDDSTVDDELIRTCRPFAESAAARQGGALSPAPPVIVTIPGPDGEAMSVMGMSRALRFEMTR